MFCEERVLVNLALKKPIGLASLEAASPSILARRLIPAHQAVPSHVF